MTQSTSKKRQFWRRGLAGAALLGTLAGVVLLIQSCTGQKGAKAPGESDAPETVEAMPSGGGCFNICEAQTDQTPNLESAYCQYLAPSQKTAKKCIVNKLCGFGSNDTKCCSGEDEYTKKCVEKMLKACKDSVACPPTKAP